MDVVSRASGASGRTLGKALAEAALAENLLTGVLLLAIPFDLPSESHRQLGRCVIRDLASSQPTRGRQKNTTEHALRKTTVHAQMDLVDDLAMYLCGSSASTSIQ